MMSLNLDSVYAVSLIFLCLWVVEIKCCHSVASLCQLPAQGAAHITSTASHKCPPAASHDPYDPYGKGSPHLEAPEGKLTT